VDVFHRLFREKPFFVSIMLAKSSGRLEDTEATPRVFSAAIACGLNKGREVGRKVVLVCGGGRILLTCYVMEVESTG
jgi:hypothetical protein